METDDYVFQAEWEQRQQEPVPEFTDRKLLAVSPLAFDQIPPLNRETPNKERAKEYNEKNTVTNGD